MNLSPAEKVYFRLLRYVMRYWFPFLIGIIGLIVHSLAEIAFIDLLRFMTDTIAVVTDCLLYTSPSPRDRTRSRMPSSA